VLRPRISCIFIDFDYKEKKEFEPSFFVMVPLSSSILVEESLTQLSLGLKSRPEKAQRLAEKAPSLLRRDRLGWLLINFRIMHSKFAQGTWYQNKYMKSLSLDETNDAWRVF
jgi:hypothetical protein